MGDTPLVALLATRRRRRPESTRGWWLSLGLASLVLALLRPPGELVGLASVLLVLAYPLAVACRNASLLGSLRQGGCLEEMLSTRTSASEWLDDLARASLSEVLASWRWLAALWLLWGLTFWQLGPWSALLALAGPLAQAAAAGAAAYVAGAGQAWSHGEDDLGLRTMLMLLVLLPGLVLGTLSWPLGLALLLSPWRALGVAGLLWAPALRERATRAWRGWMSRRGNRWTAFPLARNAIVYRESCAEAHRVPGGLLGLLLWRHAPVLGLAFVLAGTHSRPLVWLGLVLLLLVQTLQSAYRTVGSLVVEREANTLESLLATPLSTREWVDGWAAVGFAPRWVELLLAGPVLVLACGSVDLGWGRGLAAVTVITLLATAAAYAGVLASARAGSRGRAHDLVGLELCARLWGAGILGLLGTLTLPASLAWLPALLAAALVGWLRRSCLERLRLVAPVELNWLRHCLRWAAPLGFVRRVLERLEQEKLIDPPSPGLGPALSLGLGQKAPPGFSQRLLARLEEEAS